MSAVFVLIGLILLFLSKKFLVKELTILIHRLGGNQHTAIIVWSVIFLPVTIVHEISHFLVAALTGARTGKIDIFPEYLESVQGDEGRVKVALGSVQTQKLNPLRGFFVGIAPFISGIVLLIWLSSLLQLSFQNENYPLIFLQGYLFFTIANSFFPSWPDIKQTLPLIVISLVLFIFAWIFGFQMSLRENANIQGLLSTLFTTLVISILLNAAIFAVLYGLNQIKRRNH